MWKQSLDIPRQEIGTPLKDINLSLDLGILLFQCVRAGLRIRMVCLSLFSLDLPRIPLSTTFLSVKTITTFNSQSSEMFHVPWVQCTLGQCTNKGVAREKWVHLLSADATNAIHAALNLFPVGVLWCMCVWGAISETVSHRFPKQLSLYHLSYLSYGFTIFCTAEIVQEEKSGKTWSYLDNYSRRRHFKEEMLFWIRSLSETGHLNKMEYGQLVLSEMPRLSTDDWWR